MAPPGKVVHVLILGTWNLLSFMAMGNEGNGDNSGCRAGDTKMRRWSRVTQGGPMEPQELTSLELEAEDREPEIWVLR